MSESPDAATKPTPTRMVPIGLPDLIAMVLHYSSPANKALQDRFEEAAKAAKEAGATDADASKVAIESVDHHAVVKEWAAAHPHEAASLILCTLYLTNARTAAQLNDEPAEDESNT